jgi:lysophospholipid acyltransferase (LPLAT)-like uncharacterized protein
MFKEIKYFIMVSLLPPLIYLFLRLLGATMKITHMNREVVSKGWQMGENFIVCFWHGRLLLMPFAKKSGKGKVLISRHRDGEFIARVIRFFGFGTIRGSYRKGSVSSLREILTDLKNGHDVAITPDGPKGPRYEVKKGIVELARLTGKAIVPVTYGAGKKKLFIPGIALFSPTPLRRLSFSGETPSISLTV